MSINMKTLTQAFAEASAVIEKTVQTTVQEVTGLPRPMQDYHLIDQIASAGPALAWKLYSARSRDGHLPAAYPTLCVWVLDKKALSEARQRVGLSKAAEDAFLDVIRADAARLVRLRHPGVVHVVQALDESKNTMAMVTEPLFASAANALGNVENIPKVPKELKDMEMGLLEVKHGLLQIAETLDFLHNNAHLIHRAISPEIVLITSNGAWKLGGFGFAISTDQSNDSASMQAFHYAEYDVEDSVLPLQPSINYTAPELVRSKTSLVGSASDIFSFACLAYHLIARKPLFDCRNNVKMYMNSLTYLTSEAFFAIPRELAPYLQRMLSADEALRPTFLDFTGSSFFQEDTRLRALRFLDHMLERDNMQKSQFLKALSDMWKDFDPRILRYKVLPPLCAELRNLVMQPMILPMVLTIAESQDKNDFELSTLPALIPVLSTAAGDTLLLLVKHAELIINKASQDHLTSYVLPMLVRAYDDNDARLQEEVLKRTVPLAKQLEVQTTSNSRDLTRQQTQDPDTPFRVGQRVHFIGQLRRIGTVKYLGPVEGYAGDWVGVDWDSDGEGKHDGSHNGVSYFNARGQNTASFVRPHNLSAGVSLLQALEARYRTASTKEEEDEMYVLSARNKRVSIELLGKDKIEDKVSRFEELTSASLSCLGVSFPGSPDSLSSTLPNLKELDLAGNLLANWEDVGIICESLPALTTLNLSNNSMAPDITVFPDLSNIRILVLNQTGVTWKQMEALKDSLRNVEELHLMENKLTDIAPMSSTIVQGFNLLRLLNLENNCISAWDEIIKLSQLSSLEQLLLNNNKLNRLCYPDYGPLHEPDNGNESFEKNTVPFKSLRSLFLGGNNIEDLDSIDSLNSFPNLMDIRLSDNPVADLGEVGVPRFVFIARLAKVKSLNGSEVSPRERKDSEIRYVRLVLSKCDDSPEEIRRLHPRFCELKKIHGIDDEKVSIGASGPQKMASELISVCLKCVGPSMGEKLPLVKKLPATTTVGKLKNLCESFFKLKFVKPVLFLQEEGSPLPRLLEDDMASLIELGVANESTILLDELPSV